MRKKRNKLPNKGFVLNMKTGEISEVVSITKATIEGINTQLNEMRNIIKEVSGYSHSRKIDARITKHLASFSK